MTERSDGDVNEGGESAYQEAVRRGSEERLELIRTVRDVASMLTLGGLAYGFSRGADTRDMATALVGGLLMFVVPKDARAGLPRGTGLVLGVLGGIIGRVVFA